jgi:sugar phosphate isomerase/epimerase
MNQNVSRRQLFGYGLSALAGASLTNTLPMAEAADAPKRNGKTHMKLSLAAYSFNSMLSKNWSLKDPVKEEQFDLFQFVDYCAKLDLDGTELTSYYFPKDVNAKYLMDLKQQTFRLGLDISGTAIGNNFCLPAGPARDAQIASCKTWIDHAATMGAPVIRIFAGRIPKGGSEAEALDLCVAGIDECLEYAATKGVFLALENHGGITATPAQLIAIIKRIKPSEWFGVNYDSGNFRTDDPYADLEQIAPYAINAQIKVTVTAKGQKQPADLKRMVDILKQANYRGYVVLEYEEREPLKEIPEYIHKLRELIG